MVWDWYKNLNSDGLSSFAFQEQDVSLQKQSIALSL